VLPDDDMRCAIETCRSSEENALMEIILKEEEEEEKSLLYQISHKSVHSDAR
jgi:hypothetical protein